MTLAMNVQADDLGKLNLLYQLEAILQNMFTNIQLIEQGSAGEIITVENANLFQLASQYYGDATKWNIIAEANGLVDPIVEATIVIAVTAINFLLFYGIPTTDQKIDIRITTSESVNNYTYTTTELDTISSILKAFNQQIYGSVIHNDQLQLPPYLFLEFTVRRIINLTIPQTSTNETGGIWRD